VGGNGEKTARSFVLESRTIFSHSKRVWFGVVAFLTLVRTLKECPLYSPPHRGREISFAFIAHLDPVFIGTGNLPSEAMLNI